MDSIASFAGTLVLRYPELKTKELAEWIGNPDLGVRRVFIIFQLKYKGQTDRNFYTARFLPIAVQKNFS